jgi:ferritin-like protein
MAFSSRMRQLQWAPAIEDFGVAALQPKGLGETKLVAEQAVGSISQMIRELVLPVPAAPAPPPSPLSQAVLLLQIASEVEHAFLLQYLYAAYSLNAPAGSMVAAAQRQFVKVARQEMAHLITVQNLLLALGRSLDLNREDFPAHPDLYPFPAALEPVSSDTLAKYVTAEAPASDEIDPADRALAEAAAAQIAIILPSVHRVGVIYAVLYWLFQSGDQPEGPWTLPQEAIDELVAKYGTGFHVKDGDFADSASIANFSATKDEWGGDGSMHIDPGAPRASALSALYTISTQGEGPATDPAMPSHFQVFLKIYGSFSQFPSTAVLQIPANPSVVSPQSPDAGLPNAITNPDTSNWARLLSARYRMLLLDILLGMSLDRTKEGPLRQTIIADWAVGSEMQSFISPIARSLTKKMRGAAADIPQFAGAPFEFGDQLPDAPCDRWREQNSLIQTCAELIATLLTSASVTNEDRQLLQDITTFDSTRQTVIDGKIKQLCR